MIELRNSKWQIELIIVRVDGSSVSFAAMHALTLDEAKYFAANAMKKQNGGHSCTEDCLAWEEF